MTIAPQTKLFTPISAGSLDLKHRIVMAPLTRMRAEKGTGVQLDRSANYYTQRATDGGLIISEATFIHEEARGYEFVPGIYSPEQIAGWKKVTDGVHSKGGKIFCQLWALGRVADPSISPVIYSAGSIPDDGTDLNGNKIPTPTLHIMTEDDITRFVGHYAQAAKNAVEAGFDGVEIHGANGYLLDQFLQNNSNDRTDSYGGSLSNKFRFPLAVLNAVCAAIGPSRVGIRMSPYSRFQGMREPKPLDTFVPWTRAILTAQPQLAYVHATEGRAQGAVDTPEHLIDDVDTLQPIREVVQELGDGTRFVVAGGFLPDSAKEHAEKYGDDLVAFGRYFISNPDLPRRVENGWPLKKYQRETFYTQSEEGYVDFPEYKALEQDDALHSSA
ncbi:hypothetical protein CI109_105390 [Kwoniella shandongensis]|uniref:Uncharacterized protein n=1 Tax=Kwoniella shandongensis TaxID=1734106 RepID=A0A5M6BTE2_9TREE|nr:uncharacterized protein CI109_006309 [Kwoniella shandongensis]KAA5525330.1 hypothetical protein CI109_006309 [Kwoniella shandongensis]